jgi:ribosome-binding factor A
VNYRRQRVAADLRDRISVILARSLRDPRLDLVTITDVEVSADYGYARVFYRTPGDRDEVAAALDGARGFIRRALAPELKIRRVPELDFRIDESVDRGARIEELLAELDLGKDREETGE